MRKISSTEIAQVLHDGANQLSAAAVELTHLRQKVAMMERHRDAEKLASAMHGKGIDLDRSFEDLTAYLEGEAERGHLPEIQRAVEMTPLNMGIKTASLTSNDDRRGNTYPAEQRFLDGLVGEVG